MQFFNKINISVNDAFWYIEEENAWWEQFSKEQLSLTGAFRENVCGTEQTAIASALMARYMLSKQAKGEYADIMERALYNDILCAATDSLQEEENRYLMPELFVESMYSTEGSVLYTHLYVGNQAELLVNGEKIQYYVTTSYPWDETVTIHMKRIRNTELTVAFRLPGWCRDYAVLVNGECAIGAIEDGYVYITDTFAEETTFTLCFEMPVRVLRNHGVNGAYVGKVAVMRGPVVYCVERAIHESEPYRLFLDTESEAELTGVVLEDSNKECQAVLMSGFRLKEDLYEEAYSFEREEYYEQKQLLLVPYYVCGKQDETEKLVWINRI